MNLPCDLALLSPPVEHVLSFGGIYFKIRLKFVQVIHVGGLLLAALCEESIFLDSHSSNKEQSDEVVRFA